MEFCIKNIGNDIDVSANLLLPQNLPHLQYTPHARPALHRCVAGVGLFIPVR